MKYRVEVFRADGRFLREHRDVEAPRPLAAAQAVEPDMSRGYEDFGRLQRKPYTLVSPEPTPYDAGEPCPRCGGSRAACGGPTDPHE